MDASSSAPEFHFDTGQAPPNLFIACHTRKMTFCMLHKKKKRGERGLLFPEVFCLVTPTPGGIQTSNLVVTRAPEGQGMEGFVGVLV